MSTTKILQSANFDLLHHGEGNRPLNLAKHRKLVQSMKQYGFIGSMPIVCLRNKDGKLVVRDGQHRLAAAELLGIPFYYVVEETDFDIAVINSTPKIWDNVDYAEKYRADGIRDYAEGLSFAASYRIPVATAFAILAGATTFGNISEQFRNGRFRITAAGYAMLVADVWMQLTSLKPEISTSSLLKAIMMVCRVPEFDAVRMIDNAKAWRDKLHTCSSKAAYLDMIEELYNYKQRASSRVELRRLAEMCQNVKRSA